MGGVVVDTDLVEEIRTDALRHAGGVISPFNAWLIMRGTITLPGLGHAFSAGQHSAAAFRTCRVEGGYARPDLPR